MESDYRIEAPPVPRGVSREVTLGEACATQVLNDVLVTVEVIVRLRDARDIGVQDAEAKACRIVEEGLVSGSIMNLFTGGKRYG